MCDGLREGTTSGLVVGLSVGVDAHRENVDDETIDNTAAIAGRWTTSRRDNTIDVDVELTQSWQPTGVPPLMNLMTRIAPVFRNWPTT